MNTAKIATALNTISVAFGELAEALSEGAPAAPVAAPAAKEASPFIDIPDEAFAVPPVQPQGSLAQCPSHRANYLAGKYGAYCPAKSDDPAWANRKGYCTITPDTAADWLRIHAA